MTKQVQQHTGKSVLRKTLQKERVEASIVWILNEGLPWGMGCLMGHHVLTAAHCIPRAPRGSKPGEPVTVEVAPLKEPTLPIELYVRGYEPCLDIALLGTSALDGSEVPLELEQEDRFESLDLQVEEPNMQLLPELRVFKSGDEIPVQLLNHRGEWVSGRIKSPLPNAFWLQVHLDQSGGSDPGTSGAPVFSNTGTVLGVVSVGRGERTQSVTITYLKNSLPGWFLLGLSRRGHQILLKWLKEARAHGKNGRESNKS